MGCVSTFGSACVQHAHDAAPVVYTFPKVWALPGFILLAALALMVWWDAWSHCVKCDKQRAYCQCNQGDIRRPKFNDPLSRKRRGK